MADATRLVPEYLTLLWGKPGEMLDEAQTAASITIRGYCGYATGTIGGAPTQAEQFMGNALLPVQDMMQLLGLPETACRP